MSHGIHVADYDLGSIARANDVFHVAVIHDDDPVSLASCCGMLNDFGMKAEGVIKKLDGTTCGMRRSSCPDQLCRAIEQAMK